MPHRTTRWTGTAVSKRDSERRDAVRKLLADGKLGTGKDYRFAASIFSALARHRRVTAGARFGHDCGWQRPLPMPGGWQRRRWTGICNRSISTMEAEQERIVRELQ